MNTPLPAAEAVDDRSDVNVRDRRALVELAARLLDVLPQTQCTKCGFSGCAPYAEAIAAGAASIDRCPPGGTEGVARLAQLSGLPVRPLDPARGRAGPLRIARIDPTACIGCMLCIHACPVDAIVGAPRRMHVVLVDDCTGCDLCLPPCPVDCVTMHDVDPPRRWSVADAASARRRHERREARRTGPSPRESPFSTARMPVRDATRNAEPSGKLGSPAPDAPSLRAAWVEAAVARAKSRHEERRGPP